MSSKLQYKRWLPRINLQKKLTQRLKSTVIKRPKLICEICKVTFSTWWDIREHWQSTGHKTPQQCRWCKKKTFTLHSHLCMKHWDVATVCKYCGEMFMYKEDHAKHVYFHDRKEYRCFLCGYRSKSEAVLHQHICNHYLHDKFGCNVCEKRFQKKKNLEKHLKMIHFICQYCGNTSKNKTDLNKHTEIHSDLKCVLCQQVFSQKNRLKYHYQLQHGHQDFYKCYLCFQRFAMRSRLMEHLKLKHNGISNYSCRICYTPFLYWKSYLNHFERLHVKQHSEKSKFKCLFCNFTTALKIKLQWHVEKSSGVGFFCKKCQLHLECKTIFDNHMQTHAGECIWTCEHCFKVYKSADVLRHHVSCAHKDKMMALNPRGYPCPEKKCDRYYTGKSSLARHIRRVHLSQASHQSEMHLEQTENCSAWRDEFDLKNKFFQKEVVHKEDVVSSTSHLSQKLQMKKTDELNNKDGDVYFKNKLEQKESVQLENVTSSVSHLCQALLMEQSEDQTTKSDDIAFKNKVELQDSEPPSVCSRDIGNHVVNLSDVVEVNAFYCGLCKKFWFARESQFKIHMDIHSNMVWDGKCSDCNLILDSEESAVKHNVEHHLKVKFIS